MLSKSAARRFFLVGTAVCAGAFLLLTLDTIKQVPTQTKSQNITEEVRRGKDLWDSNNCMGCHTLFGEGAYYAPELTKVYERRGEGFIRQMLKDPEAMYPGQRKMTNYKFNDQQITDLVAFLKWAGQVDLNGFPAKPDLGQVAVSESKGGQVLAQEGNRPKVYNQMCIACHQMNGQGGNVGPALDGVGSRRDAAYLTQWLKNPAQVKADSKMPNLNLKEEEVTELVAFLSQLK